MQREIEAAGISTVSLSMIPDFTASVGAPRVAGIAYPMGRPFGQPGEAAGQAAVLIAALELLAKAERPGTIRYLPFQWPESPDKARAGSHPPVPPPISQLIKRKPWLYMNLLSRDIPR